MVRHKLPTKAQRKKLSKLLGRNEEVVCVTSIGDRYFWILLSFFLIVPFLIAFISQLIFFGYFQIPGLPWLKYLWIPGLIIVLYNTPKYGHLIRMRQSYTYALTDHRFLIIRGLFSRKIVTAPLDRITHITVEQSFVQRYLYDCGDLVIITAGFDQREIVIENIGRPVEFKILLEELTEKLEDAEEGNSEDLNLRALSA
ncbi:hypothetical protein A2165_04470 [Candidatus Curtissbacteria bacterium RBG_13_40_7]|uniref:YdbS-like PH domain-containing protein n=1 Tax=Candidatus Curtissbacteria bacterium RBG_13_40_7 TaxID=1797706 RepID=A0A1F5FVA3_9BACT|nr:MAG: hypothetical protein A2165_04470 [Candidatus Curtissbacteria bacterium RBG_13_40_7]